MDKLIVLIEYDPISKFQLYCLNIYLKVCFIVFRDSLLLKEK